MYVYSITSYGASPRSTGKCLLGIFVCVSTVQVVHYIFSLSFSILQIITIHGKISRQDTWLHVICNQPEKTHPCYCYYYNTYLLACHRKVTARDRINTMKSLYP